MHCQNTFIKLDNICKTFGNKGNKVVALNGISLEINKGEFLSIVGPSGSGKTTLLNIIGFLIKPSSGSYIFENTNALNYNDNELSAIRNKKIGFIFQAYHLLPYNVWENVKLPLVYMGISRNEIHERIKWALEIVDLLHRKNHRVNELSGGEQQRVAIARAIVSRPSIICADEPTGNLDSKNSDNIMHLLLDINENTKTTILLVTHNENISRRSKRIIYLEDGKLLN